MSKSTLFVCRSCHHSEQKPSEQPVDGTALCDHIQTLHQTWSRQSELEVRGVDCLWTCDHPCSIALIGDSKPTYALAKILVKDGNHGEIAEAVLQLSECYLDNHGEIAEAVLQLSECYLDSKKGNIPWKQFPEILKTEFIARIPPSDFSDSDEAS